MVILLSFTRPPRSRSEDGASTLISAEEPGHYGFLHEPRGCRPRFRGEGGGSSKVRRDCPRWPHRLGHGEVAGESPRALSASPTRPVQTPALPPVAAPPPLQDFYLNTLGFEDDTHLRPNLSFGGKRRPFALEPPREAPHKSRSRPPIALSNGIRSSVSTGHNRTLFPFLSSKPVSGSG